MTAPAIGTLVAALAERDDVGLHTDTGFVSWRAHLAQSRRRIAALTALLPADRPPHIGILAGNLIETSYLLAAAALSPLVVVGLNTTRRGAGLAADIALADCALLLVESETAPLLDGLDLGIPVYDVHGPEWAEIVDAAPDPEPDVRVVPDADDLMVLIFTSGTTGDPKAVRCTQGQLAASGVMLAERFEIGADDVVYVSMPMFHSNAIIAGWSVAVAGGASIALRHRFSASGFVDDLRRFGVTYANYVGKPLNYVLATPERPDDADTSLRLVYGNEAAADDRARFAERFGCRVVDGFGSSEGGVAITRTPETPPDALGPLRPPTMIVDVDTDEPVSAGQVGEIVNSSGAGLFQGYYNNPVATAERLRGGMYRTGDLGWTDDDGFIHFAGRLGDWLRVDGENLGTGPIERILLRHPAVRLAAVYGRPADIGDEIHAVLVVDDPDALDPDEFTAFLDAQPDLGPKQWPRAIHLRGELPETATFKTVRRALAASDAEPNWERDPHAYRARLTAES